MKINRNLAALVAVLVVILVVVGVRLVIWTSQSTDGGKPIPAIGGPFQLTDHTGRKVSDADYRGRYMLIFFGYTFCPDVCPTTLATVTAAMDKLPPASTKKLVPIFVSIDPERDTVEVMKDYVNAFSPDIVGLTGTPEEVAKVAKVFKVYAAKVKSDSPEHYTVDHSAILYLMGPDGKFVAHFTHGVSPDDLAAGLKKHLG